uniref:Mediator of RNA polymerase II transcription subunit 15 n=1 Tax=Anopheles dirus TaxID=7168 RepID=A0A182NUI6_9DIPT
MAEDNSWKTSNFRQSVVNKINEAIQQTGMTSSKNGIEMESHVFHKARNKDEYLGFVARLILHVREMNTKQKNQQNAAAAAAQQAQQDGSGNSGQQGAGGGGGGGGGAGMPDPINALQNLASQGTRPQMMGQMGVGPGGPMGGQMGGGGNASNLLHSLRPQMQMGGMGGPMQGNRVGMGPGPGGQMGMMGPNQMQGPGGGMVGGMPGQMGVGIGPGGMSGGKIVGMGGQQQMAQLSAMQVNQMQQQQQQQQQQQGGMAQAQQQQQQGGMAQGQGGPVQQMAVGGPNQMNPMVMGQIQAQLQNQNVMGGGQQMGSVGGNMGSGNQMGPMVGANAGMNPQVMGMAANQVLRQQQQQQQQQGMPQVVNPNQVQMGLGPGVPMQQQAMQQQAGAMGQAGPNQMNAGVPMGGPGGVGPNVGGVMGPGPGQMLGGGGAGGAAGQQQANFVGMGAGGMVRKPPDMMPGGNVYPGGGGAVRSVTPNNFLRQSPSPSVPSPVGPGAHGPPSHPGQMIPSPALIPSPNPHMGGVAQRSNIGQSPGGSLNTPGQPGGAVPSPLNPQDEQLYREKYRSLTKYIEPLKRMIAKMENDDIDKIAKMKRLLEILSNPSVRIPLETLHKCEAALTSQLGSIRETPTNNPLVEAVSASLQGASGNHTLQRTFRPCLEALFGPDIKNLPPPAKQPRLAPDDATAGGAGSAGAAGGSAGTGSNAAATGTTTAATAATTTSGSSTGTGSSSSSAVTIATTTTAQEIPHILQGEIARLDQKFKVLVDQCAISGTRTIKLICWLDDKNLPCVPPVAVTIPEDYPFAAPSCSLIEQEYNATPFLILVQKSLMARICKLPGLFTLSHLLDTWEMSVRQACSPNPTIVAPTGTSVLLGM